MERVQAPTEIILDLLFCFSYFVSESLLLLLLLLLLLFLLLLLSSSHLRRMLIGELKVYKGIKGPSGVRPSTFSNDFLL